MENAKMQKVDAIQLYLTKMMECFDITEAGGGSIQSGLLSHYLSSLEYQLEYLKGREPKVEDEKQFKDALKTLKEQIGKFEINKYNRGTVNIITEEISKLQKILNESIQKESKKKSDVSAPPITFKKESTQPIVVKKEDPMDYIEKFMDDIAKFGSDETSTVSLRMITNMDGLKKLMASMEMPLQDRDKLVEDFKKMDEVLNKHAQSNKIEENPKVLDKLQESFTGVIKDIRKKISKFQNWQEDQKQEKDKGPDIS